MKSSYRPLFVLALVAPILGSSGLGCSDSNSGNSDSDGSSGANRPYRDAWDVVVDADFIHTSADGIEISTITIGGRESNDNFANRGDIIVDFTGPPNRILVEMRRFTFASNDTDANDAYLNLQPWAYTSSLGRPQDQSPADSCFDSWKNGCEFRVYYDGQNQLNRAGADIRVTLPADYRQGLTIITEDNVGDDSYFNRGDVCINNLFSSPTTVETQSGNVWVKLNPESSPAPECSPAQIQKCEEWTTEDETGATVPAAWDPQCGCVLFGSLNITNRSESSSNITVDVPGNLWTTITALNKSANQSVATGEFCEANVTIPNAVMDEESGNDFPWQAKFSANYPGKPAVSGAGFNVQASSSECGPVAFTNSPDEYVGDGNGSTQESAIRGNIEVCTDCIVQGCNDLIP